MSGGIELEQRGDRGLGRLGDNDFNHTPHAEVEVEYRRKRQAVDEEYAKRKDCMQRAHEAYERGDGASAKQLSNEGKHHAAEAERLEAEASIYIFTENNANIAGDTIDLHGQNVQQAINILRKRIEADQRAGQGHLHVIVGKGNHSVGHIQRLKPAVEDFCRESGLHYKTEENAGRIYVDLQGNEVTHMPPLPSHGPTQHAAYGEHHSGGHHGQQQQQQHHHQQQQQQHEEEQQYEELDSILTKLLKKVCCTVM